MFDSILNRAPVAPVRINPVTPLKLEEIIHKALEKDRDVRCQSAAELRADLKRLKRDTSSSRSESVAPSSAATEPVRDTPPASTSDSVVIANLIKRHRRAALASVVVAASLVALAWFGIRRPPSAKLAQKSLAELREKRLTFNSGENGVYTAALSPDGKYLAYSDRAGIHVKLLSTSEERLMPRPAGVAASAFWLVTSWFPDGTQLLASSSEPGGQGSMWAGSMWTVSVLGSSPRALREDASGYQVSPDGAHIAFSPLAAPGLLREVWVIGSQGDNPQKVLAVGENESLSGVRWSPDGHRLAYLRERSGQTHQNSIETCDLKGASRTVVLSADVHLGDACWLPDGRIVYPRWESRNSSDADLWQIGIDNHAGTPIGEPTRMTHWSGSYLVGLSASADGKQLALLKYTYQAQAYLGELAAGGTRMNPPRRLTNDEASDTPNAWMADSKAVLFTSQRNGIWGIFKQGITQETSEPVFMGPQDVFVAAPVLSADGASILFVEHPATASNAVPSGRLMRVPANGGVAQFVLETRNPVDLGCAHRPTSLCVISEPSPDRKQLVITAFDPLKGRGKVLRTIDQDPSHTYNHASLSPDGSKVAISRELEAEIRIRLLSLSGTADREIAVKGWPDITGLGWSLDGKGLYCGSSSARACTLLYVDMDGNARVLWQHKGGGTEIRGVPSPDGRFLAIQGAVINSNVWM
ncbi:MAG: hypothetical protein WBW33_31115, partial [Bryobacteraceae bacterium]